MSHKLGTLSQALAWAPGDVSFTRMEVRNLAGSTTHPFRSCVLQSFCPLFPLGFLLSSSGPGVGQDAHKTHKGLRKVHWWLNNVYYLRTPSRTAVSILAKFAESHFSGKKLDFQHLKKRSEFRPLFIEFVLSSHNRHNVPDCFISFTGVQTSWWVWMNSNDGRFIN